MKARLTSYAAFTLSGVAGLAYEVVWTRYLALYVGHSAYAQVLVLAVYLGGTAVGALAVSDLSTRLRRPLLWYAGVEAALAVAGLAFHLTFVVVTELTYARVFPALGSASLAGAVRFGAAGLLVLPQAVLLGTTFPLMAAALVRGDDALPGRSVATAYLTNTLGGAAGVLITGFWLISRFGFPGALVGAALLNLSAASLAWWAQRAGAAERSSGHAEDRPGPDPAEVAETASVPVDSAQDLRNGSRLAPAPWARRPDRLEALVLTVSFGTAVASFAYEIGWIRMLSLVLGSATHAFELMLSAFILGLAVGAWLVRDLTDRVRDPLLLLGVIQVLMGLAAVATLPVYVASFNVVGQLVTSLPGRDGGYVLFNLSRYVLCLAIMLPATVTAGMTVPILAGTLMRAGTGERAIGRVYGVNTLGSVVGSGLAGLVALPALGLKGLLVAGAALDAALGTWVLWRAARARGARATPPAVAATLCAVALVGVALGVRLDRRLLTSAVYRFGRVPERDSVEVIYYRDGRTATVSAHVHPGDGILVLSTNGKPDASVGPRWYVPGLDTLPPVPIERGRDFTTQVLAPLVALAHTRGPISVANIGHGSGMTGTTLLASPSVERLVTIEIEPRMVEGSSVFLPMNRPVFEDPRSTFAFDDAKSYFAYRQERFDLVFAEPSNPWVSGVSSLFTTEFYSRIRGYLTEDGVLAQWVQIYELDDDLFLTILAGLDAAFPSYRGYLVGDGDILIVASGRDVLPDPDWSVLGLDGVHRITRGAPAFTGEHMQALELFDQTTFGPVLEDAPANSDFHPILDLGAERARFRSTQAEGLYSFAANRLDLRRSLAEVRQEPLPHRLVPARGLEPAVLWGRASWMREALASGGGLAPLQFAEWTNSLINLRNFMLETRDASAPVRGGWTGFASSFDRAERELHWGTAGWVDEDFYGLVYDFLDRAEAPVAARAVVDLMHGVGSWRWEQAAAAADVLVGRAAAGEPWVRPTVLLDAAVLAYLKTGRRQAARNAYRALVGRTGRTSWNLRNRLLDALIREAEER